MTTFKRLLKERNLTVQQFADKAGLNKHSLNVYVSEAKAFDKSQMWFVMKIADALGIDPHEPRKSEWLTKF